MRKNKMIATPVFLLTTVLLLACAAAAKPVGAAKQPGAGQARSEATASGGRSGAQPAAAPESVAVPAAPTAVAVPVKPSGPDPQSDEGAGKGADLQRIASSPKDGSPYLGAKDALVVVNIFSDFQCPVCSRAADPIKQLVLDFPGKVKVFFRQNALEMHGRSKPAALAAMAAGKQGKFWQFHDLLFERHGLDDASLRQTAQDLGLDMAQWEKDLADPGIAERLKQESEAAVKLGAPGTPGLFVNGLRQVGWGSYQGLRSMVDRELAAGQELAAAGTAHDQIPAARIRATAGKNPSKEGADAIDAEYWVKALTAN